MTDAFNQLNGAVFVRVPRAFCIIKLPGLDLCAYAPLFSNERN